MTIKVSVLYHPLLHLEDTCSQMEEDTLNDEYLSVCARAEEHLSSVVGDLMLNHEARNWSDMTDYIVAVVIVNGRLECAMRIENGVKSDGSYLHIISRSDSPDPFFCRLRFPTWVADKLLHHKEIVTYDDGL